MISETVYQTFPSQTSSARPLIFPHDLVASISRFPSLTSEGVGEGVEPETEMPEHIPSMDRKGSVRCRGKLGYSKGSVSIFVKNECGGFALRC